MAEKTYQRVIVQTAYALRGHWGIGDTEEEAMENWRDAGGKGEVKVTVFRSHLPFAPADRGARATEADAWVDREGCLCWLRCERI